MQIPQQLPHFKEKILIVCLRHDSGLPYIAEGNKVEQLSPIYTEDTDFHYSDKEGFERLTTPSSPAAKDVSFCAGEDHHNKEHYLHIFLNYFVEKIGELAKEQKVNKLVFFVPEDMLHQLEAKLPQPLKEKIQIFPGNFYAHHILELIAFLPSKDGLYTSI